jgi:tetratricopeptide (TPR) repeat protein
MEKPQVALETFDSLARNDAFASQALAGRILALRKLGRSDEADKALESSLGESPRPSVFMNLGNAFEDFGAWTDAAESYRRAIQLNPGLPEAHNQFGWVQGEKLRVQGETLKRCLDHAQLALRLSPDSAVKGNYLDTAGWLSYRSGNLKKARRYLQQAVEILEPDMIIRHHLKVVEKELRSKGD